MMSITARPLGTGPSPDIGVRTSLWFARNRQLVLRATIVTCTLLLSVYLARTPSLIWLVPLVGVALLVPMWRSGPFGIVVFVAATVLVPFGVGTGSESAINIAVILLPLLGMRWLLDMLLRRDVRLLASRPIAPLVVMGVEALIAFLVGGQLGLPLAQLSPQRAQIGGLGIYLLSILAFLVVAHVLPNVRWLERLTWTFLIIGAVCVAFHVGLVKNSILTEAYYLVANQSIFWLCIFAFAFSQALLNHKLSLRWRLSLGVVIAVMMGYAIFRNRGWNSGWVPELVAALAILWLAKPRLAVFATIVGVTVVVVKLPQLTEVLFDTKNQYDLLTRTAAWDILWNIVSIDPVLGTGFANYYFYTQLYPILGYAVKFNSHNNYMDMIVQTGFVGLLIFGWVMFEIGRLGWRLRTRVPEGFPRAYTFGAMGLLAGMLVAAYMGDWVLPFVYNVGLNGFRASVLAWMFLGGLVVLEKTYVMKPHSEVA